MLSPFLPVDISARRGPVTDNVNMSNPDQNWFDMKCRQINVIVRLLNADLSQERYLYPWRDPGRREWVGGWVGGVRANPNTWHMRGGGQTVSHDIHYQHRQNGSALKRGQQRELQWCFTDCKGKSQDTASHLRKFAAFFSFISFFLDSWRTFSCGGLEKRR